MKPNERESVITDYIRQMGMTTVEVLARQFNTSHETIRRDLTVLAETGIIQKIHGGAKLLNKKGEGSYCYNSQFNILVMGNRFNDDHRNSP